MKTAFFARIALCCIILGSATTMHAQTTEIFVNGVSETSTPYGISVDHSDTIEIILTADKDLSACVKGLKISTAKRDKNSHQNQMQVQERNKKDPQVQKIIKPKIVNGKMHFTFRSEMLTKATVQNMYAELLTDKSCADKLHSLNKYYTFYIAK